jgi:serine phosphatase RsbU (regulator of sigma subunit)
MTMSSGERLSKRAEDATAEGISPRSATLIVVVIGVLITLSVSWTAWTLNRHNEHRLLEVQTHQAAEVLSSSILTLRDPLETVLQTESATGGNAQQLEQFATSSVGAGRPFASVALWRKVGSSWVPIASVGEPPLLAPNSEQSRSLLDKAAASPTFVVASVHSDGAERISYTIADHSDPNLAVYAERAIPANRVVPVENGSAFSDLNYATYLGPTANLAALATTDLPLSELPVSGDTVRASIPFGNSSVTLITAPRGPLGGTLGGALPWIFLVGGAALTAATAFVTNLLVSRRRKAWRDSRTIAGLYLQLDERYGEQRSISETLQQALLPQQNPSVPNLEIASRYLAGADGVEIGGDWFSIIDLEHRRFAFAVGDVSGKGVGAAAIMARLRFTVRAYLTEGHPPEVVLAMCSRQLNVNRDGHLATVLVGVGDVDSGTITVANAGHLDPLILSEGAADFTHTNVGLPLGVTSTTYTSSTIQLVPGSALVVYTDGLVERRGESLDIGMARLAQFGAVSHDSLEDFLTTITARSDGGAYDDDTAILAFRWTPRIEIAADSNDPAASSSR